MRLANLGGNAYYSLRTVIMNARLTDKRGEKVLKFSLLLSPRETNYQIRHWARATNYIQPTPCLIT